MNQLHIIQSTIMQGQGDEIGLTDLLLATLKRYQHSDIFTKTQIVVPNHAMANFAKDLITKEYGICCNYDFVVLLGPVLENIYKQNNPSIEMFDFSFAKFIIYDYLCNTQINTLDAAEINNYLYKNNQINEVNAFELATELEKIFHEYLYLRTEELIKISVNKPQTNRLKNKYSSNGELFTSEELDQSSNSKSKIKVWQQQIWQHLISKIDGKKTFIDIYLYYMKTIKIDQLPCNLFIFGLTSIYPSQLKIIKKLSESMPIFWFYLATSHQYYGDLLNNKAKDALARKHLRNPDLNLDDLYLTDGNPLLANLGQQSREFVELLRANNIEPYVVDDSIYDNYNDNIKLDDPAIHEKLSVNMNNINDSAHNSNNCSNINDDNNSGSNSGNESGRFSLLKVIQNDIRNLTYRINPDYRLNLDSTYYTNPITITSKDDDLNKIYDLPEQQLSIKINNCYNKMREVQVMFNELIQVLDKNPELNLNDILVTALDIDNYASYINAVFDNETFTNSKNQTLSLSYNITGNRRNHEYSQFETIRLLLNIPYHLPGSALLDVLTQTDVGQSLNITSNDIELIKTWLADNNTHFGYNALDYAEYGYSNYNVNSLMQLLNNIVLGACIPNEITSNQRIYPIYTSSTASYTPYDNLDNSQITLANKLIFLIKLLAELRESLYLDRVTYKEITLPDVITLLTTLKKIIVHDEISELHYTQLLGNLSLIRLNSPITLPILNQIIDDYTNHIKSKIRFDGSITCASIQYMRNIPYKVIYILGMNFGEFPRAYTPSRLSILSQDWYLADRNYTNEDKQAFLDTILACNKQLFISYIGRVDSDNSEIRPSPLLDLFLNTIGQSFTNFQIKNSIKFNYFNLLTKQSLHPFYNNTELNFSNFWAKIGQTNKTEWINLRWNFVSPPTITLTPEQQEQYHKPTLKQIINTFCFTNANLYNTLGIRNNYEIELTDFEPLVIKDKNLAKQLFKYFEQYQDQLNNTTDKLYDYLTLKGTIGYKNLGLSQFQHYLNIYQNYIKLRGTKTAALTLEFNVTGKDDQIYNLMLSDSVWLDADNNIIVCEEFHNLNTLRPGSVDDIPLQVRIKANLIYLIIQNGGKCKITNNEYFINNSQSRVTHNIKDQAPILLNQELNKETGSITENDIIINSVILRLIDNVNFEKLDFTLTVNENHNVNTTLNSYLRYYLYSLTNPTLVHKNALNAYIKGVNKNHLEEDAAISAAKNVFTASFENYDLDRLKEDIVFGNLVPEYFEFCANNKVINHIITMGKLLVATRFCN